MDAIQQDQTESKEAKQNCALCGSLILQKNMVAIPYSSATDGKSKMYLCENDAHALLRVIAKDNILAFKQSFDIVGFIVYGKE